MVDVSNICEERFGRPQMSQFQDMFRILVVNCQSIKNKKQELENLVETSKPDIMIGTESWLSNDIQSTELFPSYYLHL
jgi:hypothetical protein